MLSLGLHILSRHLAAERQKPGKRAYTALVEQIEWLTYDARVKLGAAFNDPNNVANSMATLFFDDGAFQRVNNGTYSIFYAPATNQASADQLYPRLWPWPRFIFGQIVRELSHENAAAVGFDILFPEHEKDDPSEHVRDVLEGDLTSEQFFATEMARAGNAYLAVEGETLPVLLLQTNAAGLASIASQADYAVLRRVKPFNEIRLWHPILRNRAKMLGLQFENARLGRGKMIIPVLQEDNPDAPPVEVPLNPNGSMKMTSEGDIDFADDPDDNGVEDQYPFKKVRAWNLGITLAARALGLDLDKPEIFKDRIVLHGPNGLSRTIPVDSSGYFFIDWSLRFSDIAAGRTPVYFGQLGELLISDHGRQLGETDLPQKFKNKIVVVGSVAKGNNLSDFGATPLESQTPLVTKHLNIANSILTGRFVERTSLRMECLLIVVLASISALLTWRMRVVIASIGVTGLCLSYVLFTTWMYMDYRYWIPMVMPLAGGLLLPHFALVTYRVVFEQKEQRRVKHIFTKIVSPDVVQELLSAEKLALGGARRQITVFFADVRGFTEFTDASQEAAEEFVRKNNLNDEQTNEYFNKKAAETLSTVNLYLSVIADMVKKHNGTLDKYIGDCVMAFWGAPVANETHAVDCVRAAIDSQLAIYELNQQRARENEERKKRNETLAEEGGEPLPMLPLLSLGSGINTGWAIVGLMGSDATILNYTVFGREVNLASRLEGASGRGRIFIGEATYLELKRHAPDLAAKCVPQNPIIPKGFRNPIAIYEAPWKPSPPPSSVHEAEKARPLPVV